MAPRAGRRRYLLAEGLVLLLYLGVLHGLGPPAAPPDLAGLAASLLSALAAVATAAALGVAAGGALAFTPGGRRYQVPLSMATALPSVVVGAVLLRWLGDGLGVAPGLGLVALGLAILCLPQAVLLSADCFSRETAAAQAALALGARPSQAALAVYGAVRREVAGILLGVAGRALGEAALVALLAQGLGGHGRLALQGGATLAASVWYLEITGRLRSPQAFWPVVLLLGLSLAAAGGAALLTRRRREVVGWP